MGYLAAAYAIVLVTLSGYALGLILRERATRRELRAAAGGRPRGSG
jgi:hypothetical protein